MSHFICGVVLAILLIPQAHSASIYKCTKKDGKVTFADKPCDGLKSTVIHKETAAEIQQNIYTEQLLNLQRLIEAEQLTQAKKFAVQHNLAKEYEAKVAQQKIKLAEEKQMQEQAKQAAEQAAAQAVEQAKQQSLQKQQLELQKQQLELQKQRTELEKQKLEQQQRLFYPNYDTSYYSKSVPTTPIQDINSVPAALTPMNPPNPRR